jgi:hypothetical protein
VSDSMTDQARDEEQRSSDAAGDGPPKPHEPIGAGREPRAPIRIEAHEAGDAAGPSHDPTRPTVFSVDQLTVRYGDVPAIREITFDIYENEITAISDRQAPASRP